MNNSNTWIWGGTLVGALALCVAALADSEKAGAGQKDKAETPAVEDTPVPIEMSPVEFIRGAWQVTEHHFSADGRTVKVEGTEDNDWAADKHAMSRKYQTGSGKGYEAVGYLTWNAVEEQFEGVWFDNQAFTGPTRVTCTWEESKRQLTYYLEKIDTAGRIVRYRVEERHEGLNHRIATTYQLMGAKAVKRLEVHYKRLKGCDLPSSTSRTIRVDEYFTPDG
jgi:hypothetical protein